MKQVFCLGGWDWNNRSTLNNGTYSNALLGMYGGSLTDFNDSGGRQNVIPADGEFVNNYAVNEVAPDSDEEVRYDLELEGATQGDTRVTCAGTFSGFRAFRKDVTAGEAWRYHTTDSGTALDPTPNGGCSWSVGWEGANAGEAIMGGGLSTAVGSTGTIIPNDGGDTTAFFPIIGGKEISTTESVQYIYSPMNMTITAFYVDGGTLVDAGTGGTITFSISVNGTSVVASEIVYDDTTTEGSVTGLSISVSTGDTLSIQVEDVGLSTDGSDYNHGILSWGIAYTPENDGESIIAGSITDSTPHLSTTTVYLNMNMVGGRSDDTVEEDRQCATSARYKLKNFRTDLSVAPGGTDARTFKVRKNGTDTTLSTSIVGSATTATDSANTVQYEIGDFFTIECSVASGTPADTNLYWSAVMYDVEFPGNQHLMQF